MRRESVAALSTPRSGAKPRPQLDQLQRWMQACVMAEGSVEQAVASQAASAEIPASLAPGMIRASRTLAPLERLDIYRGMYELRLVEALRVDYPGLLRLLGEEMFEELARLYIASCPSKSYTLNRLGDQLPDFISQVGGIPRPRLAVALARLELAETMVFDEEESSPAGGEPFAGLAEHQWSRIRMRPIRALRALVLDYPAHEFMQALRRDEASPRLRPRRTRLIVYRRDYALLHLPLTAPAFSLFQSLMEGETLGDAIQAMSDSGGGSQRQVFEWFRQWFSERLFQRVEIS